LLFKNVHSVYRDIVGRTDMWLNMAPAGQSRACGRARARLFKSGQTDRQGQKYSAV